MAATLARRTNRRNMLILAGFVAVIGYLCFKYVKYENLQRATTRHYSTLNQMLEDVQSLGGQVILCRNGECQDVATKKYVANGQNGYYIVYPKDAVGDPDLERSLLEHQGAELKDLTKPEDGL
jgi:hypothetical protein